MAERKAASQMHAPLRQFLNDSKEDLVKKHRALFAESGRNSELSQNDYVE